MKLEPISVSMSQRSPQGKELAQYSHKDILVEYILQFSYWNGKDWKPWTFISNCILHGTDISVHKIIKQRAKEDCWRAFLSTLKAGEVTTMDEDDNEVTEPIYAVARHPIIVTEVKD